jgi:hypothetical protein
MVVTIDIINVAIIRTDPIAIFIVAIGKCLTITQPLFGFNAIEIVVSIVSLPSIAIGRLSAIINFVVLVVAIA